MAKTSEISSEISSDCVYCILYCRMEEEAKENPHAQRIAMTLNINPDNVQEYVDHHAHSRPEVRDALSSVGIRNLSVWVWNDRLFYYAEYVGHEAFDDAMSRYSLMAGVKEWEELMQKYQVKIPGSEGIVWWQRCRLVYHQS